VTTRRRLHPALLLIVGGAAVSFGVGSVLPQWQVAYWLDGWGWSFRVGTLWEAVPGAAGLASDFPEKLVGNVLLALVFVAAGACAGLYCRLAWERLRPARRPPTSGADPARR
jgi:hypothetical protein